MISITRKKAQRIAKNKAVFVEIQHLEVSWKT